MVQKNTEGNKRMTKNILAGFDIGGTKCAVLLGEAAHGEIHIRAKQKFPTAGFPAPENCLREMCRILAELIQKENLTFGQLRGIGISCGGPLDSHTGVIQSPPNLPGWNDVPAVRLVNRLTGLPVKLQNDANACALAEWRYGAGRGTSDMIFLTFGTGLGAGIIAGGRLLEGCSGMAGECGHIRLAESGPYGYGKEGSFEGFCSGGGIARLGRFHAEQLIREGRPPQWCPDASALSGLTAKIIGDAAENGDSDARAVYEESGRRLGQGLAILIDILNPERIVIGSIFIRSESLLRSAMERSMDAEALPQSALRCRVVPALLGERLGDVASLAIAAEL